MLEYEKRINQVKSFFENKDTVLGYRKLMDCAIDTQDLHIYEEIVALTDWKEKYPDEEEKFIQKSLSILDKIATIPIALNTSNEAVLEAHEISKSYNKRSFVLGPISLKIRKSEVYGLVGENGNGKTTLLRVLAKELKSDTGRLNFDFDQEFKKDFDLRTKLVYIPQRTQKWHGSLKDNLKFVLSNYGVSPKENEIRILMMIARFGLWKYKDLKWSELSSGYKMRFELARTLLRQPELLLLDEPLANLDVLAQQVILEDLKSIGNSLNNPIAIILSSQQLYEVEKISDHVIFLKNGQYSDGGQTPVTTNDNLIIEIDCACEREELATIFSNLSLQKLVYNGGIYFAYFDGKTSFSSVLEKIGGSTIEVTYVRNISNSTRRFFVS